MRPGDFSPGNRTGQATVLSTEVRFNEAGGFLPRKRYRPAMFGRNRIASMRPGDFSPGNPAPRPRASLPPRRASMRPGDFSPGNIVCTPLVISRWVGFNEAGGFLPRKLRDMVAKITPENALQ